MQLVGLFRASFTSYEYRDPYGISLSRAEDELYHSHGYAVSRERHETEDDILEYIKWFKSYLALV